MRRKLPLAVFPLVVLLAIVLISQGNTPAGGTAADSPADTPAKAAGMMLYIDPETGEFVQAQPESYPVEMAYDDAYSSSDWGLVEESAPKGGGTMMSLQGRFLQTYAATVDGSGNLSAGCDQNKTIEPTDSDSEREGE